MKNVEFVYAVVCFYDDDSNDRLKFTTDVDSIYRTLRSAEMHCAEANKYSQNAKLNPEFKGSYMLPYRNYIKINKNQPASWFYVKKMKIN